MHSKTYQVIIIGGGVAGLAAARTLVENGIRDVLLLEAKDKLGGRILTQQAGAGLIELGAQWIHGQSNELYELAKSGGMIHEKTSVEGTGEFRTPTGQLIPLETAQSVLRTFQQHLEFIEENFDIAKYQNQKPNKNDKNGYCTETDKEDQVSVGTFLEDAFVKESHSEDNCPDLDPCIREALWDWKINFERIDNSCNELNLLSLHRWSEFQQNDGEPYNNFKSGAQAFVDQVLAPAGGGGASASASSKAIVNLSSPVTKINWNGPAADSSISVTYKDLRNNSDLTVQGQVVLSTMSVGVLQGAIEADDLFQPSLPNPVVNVLSSVGFDSITKIYLEWDHPWWNVDNFQGIQLIWPRSQECNAAVAQELIEYKWIKALQGFDPVLDNPTVLLCWASGPEAILLETMEPDHIARGCMLALRKFMGKDDVPLPNNVSVSKWFHDKYFRGAYSYRSIKSDQIQGDITKILTEPIFSNNYNNNNIKNHGLENGAGPLQLQQQQRRTPSPPFLLFAGEALHPTQYSTIHGAYDSGKSQAQKIIKYISLETKIIVE